MAIFFDAEVSPDALTAFVREVPMPANLAISNAFPTRTVDDHKVDFREVVHTNRTAKFRAFDGAISTMGRDGGSEYEVSLLPLSNSINMGEYERLQLQFARTGGTNKAALANAIYNDAQNLVASIRNRIELAWGDVLTDGKLTISENGLTGAAGEADFVSRPTTSSPRRRAGSTRRP
ncbi:major capsid protein [Lentzea sp. JNUCC 0626]|uniref:major capsid protein n=1 Tax=Lentzea sp. JNUCC 0626 TaxID=3367513 RepID=UPI003749C568